MFSGTPQSQGLLAAAAQILQASGPSRTPTSLGQILGSGLGAYQQQEQQARQLGQQGQLRDLQIKGAEADLAAQQRALLKQQKLDEAAKSAYRTAGAQASSLPGGPTNVNLARIGEFKDGFDENAYASALMTIDPLMAYQFQQQQKKAGTEYDTKPQTALDASGQPFQYLVGKNGEIKRLDGVLPRDEMKLANLGGRDVAYNPFALKDGQTFQRTMTPDGAASNALGYANLNLSRERLKFEQQFKTAAEARAEKELALKQQVGKAPTEFQGKSAAFGLRANEADKILNRLGSGPDAVTNTGLIRGVVQSAAEMTPFLGDKLGAATGATFNALPGWAGGLSEKQQQVEQARRDFVNAVLRQESGAAIGPSEFENATKQYFPQPGDSPAVIQQKARNRQLSIQGLQSNAGRAALTAPTAAGSGVTFLGFE